MSDNFLHQLLNKIGLFQKTQTKVVDEDKGKDRVIKQLHRIKGQVAGIEHMYHDKRSCTDIVYQIMAVKSSLDTVAKELLTNEIVACTRKGDVAEVKKLMKEVVK